MKKEYYQHFINETFNINDYLNAKYFIANEFINTTKYFNLEQSKQIEKEYFNFVSYLKNKYGEPPYNYFCKDNYQSRNTNNKHKDIPYLQIHHIKELDYSLLSDNKKSKQLNIYNLHNKSNLVYCNLWEHYYLHYLIQCRNNKPNGGISYINKCIYDIYYKTNWKSKFGKNRSEYFKENILLKEQFKAINQAIFNHKNNFDYHITTKNLLRYFLYFLYNNESKLHLYKFDYDNVISKISILYNINPIKKYLNKELNINDLFIYYKVKKFKNENKFNQLTFLQLENLAMYLSNQQTKFKVNLNDYFNEMFKPIKLMYLVNQELELKQFKD